MTVTPSVAPVPRPEDLLGGRALCLTGGTGTFGQAFARFALAAGARKVVIVSRGEAKQAQMRAALADERLRFLIGDVRNEARMAQAVRGCEIVIHAAALKRIEVCEQDPSEAVATNVLGTEAVLRACLSEGVQRAVFLSTDKAAAPNTLYGHTKATAERLWVNGNVYAAGLPTRFAATRYGNVLGSTGSVIPIWRAQAAAGEAITVTDPSMTRFFMRIEDAVQLVATALRDMVGGEVFVPKLGAASVLALLGATVPEGREVVVTGMRRGEKRHETLISEDEAPVTTDRGGYYVIEPERTWEPMPVTPLVTVPHDFTYRSDTARALSPEELRGMAA